MITREWEPVIGLEVHVQLKTRTKMFCRCEVGFGAPENTRTCPVCLAHPGSLPVPNRRAVEWTIRLGLALGCKVAPRAVFHRKNYFYPDNPKAYQISQYDEPLCVGGRVVVPGETGEVEVGIVRAHLEEDAAKSIHVGGAEGRIGGADRTLVDFNRAGTPLVEIVTGPDLRSAPDARRFLQLLRQTIVELGISDAEMEKGTFRFDVNVSVRPAGSDELRTRTELKNMNSFAFAARGIEREIRRQIEVYESGGTIDQETLHFDPTRVSAPPLRSKEEAQDYRYFPEPDLVPIEPDPSLVAELERDLPELPAARTRRLRSAYGLSFYDAEALSDSPELGALFEGAVAAGAEGKSASNVLMNEFRATGVSPEAVDPYELAKLIEARARLQRPAFAEALARSGDAGFAAADYLGQSAISGAADLLPLLDRVLAANEAQVVAYRGGKHGLLGFFVGEVMRESQGRADARVVSELLRERLGGAGAA